MHGNCAQAAAEHGVVAVGGDCADGVHGVQVLDCKLSVVLLHSILCHVTLNVRSDIHALDIPTFVLLDLILSNSKFLSHLVSLLRYHAVLSPLSNHDHAVALDLGPLNDGLVHTLFSLELEMHLGNETDVHITRSQAAGNCDVATVATHELDDANTVLGGFGLNIGRVDELDGGLAGCLEAKAAVDERNIIIDSLRYAANAYLESLFP